MTDPASFDPSRLFLHHNGSVRVPTSTLYQPFLAALYRCLRACAARGAYYFPTSGYRSFEEQKILHAKYLAGGNRAVAAGYSAHNYGLAVDVARGSDPPPGLANPDWSDRGYAVLFEEIAKEPLLASGRRFGDNPHIGMTGYESGSELAPLRDGYLKAPRGGELAAVWAYLNGRRG